MDYTMEHTIYMYGEKVDDFKHIFLVHTKTVIVISASHGLKTLLIAPFKMSIL